MMDMMRHAKIERMFATNRAHDVLLQTKTSNLEAKSVMLNVAFRTIFFYRGWLREVHRKLNRAAQRFCYRRGLDPTSTL